MKLENINGLRTWIEIDKSAIAHNYETFRGIIGPRVKMMAVVKSNAYGHELTQFSKELQSLGIDFLGVDSVVEALRLRTEGITVPILVLGYTLPEMVSEAAKHDISITVSNIEMLKYVTQKVSEPIKMHIKVDTGMHRQGFLASEMDGILELIRRKPAIFEGLYTHFAGAKDASDVSYDEEQLVVFSKWLEKLKDLGLSPLIHASATSGTLLHKHAHFDMVRTGIGMYGVWPSQAIRAKYQKQFKLQPALTWKTIISEVKTIPTGSSVGYDRTEIVKRETRIAVIPIGYWHGYSRLLSSKGNVLVRAKRARVLGRVSMDMIVADVSDIDEVCAGDEVVLLGAQGSVEISAYELADISQTIPYEFLTRINPLIKKIYV